MKQEHIDYLVCPKTRSSLVLEDGAEEDQGRIKKGWLISDDGEHRYPIVNFIPRFVEKENYASNFGYQWDIHARTQYDRFTGCDASERRLFEETRWPRNLSGERIVEVGSGAGRFTEHLVSTGAFVVSFDYSNAVETNYKLNGKMNNLLVVQGDIYNPPVPDESFDRVLCVGVIQHTPFPKKAFLRLPALLRAGGNLVVDVYRRDKGIRGLAKKVLQTKYWVRPVTRRMKPSLLYRVCSYHIRLMWPFVKLVNRLPKIGPILVRTMLVADNGAGYQIPDSLRKEWALLDTFDWLSPMYDDPQTLETLQSWFSETLLVDCEVAYGYNGIEGRGTAPKKTSE